MNSFSPNYTQRTVNLKLFLNSLVPVGIVCRFRSLIIRGWNAPSLRGRTKIKRVPQVVVTGAACPRGWTRSSGGITGGFMLTGVTLASCALERGCFPRNEVRNPGCRSLGRRERADLLHLWQRLHRTRLFCLSAHAGLHELVTTKNRSERVGQCGLGG